MAATAAAEPGERFATLDIVRGVAVMGILAMNIVAFAMPPAAYVNPLAYGTGSAADLASYIFSFVLIDGKMRGLFSFLFGASMLLVIERAEAKGESGAAVHYRRQAWLLLFGAIHFYLIWFGDILFGYALIGMVAFLFRKMSVRALTIWGALFVLVELLIMGGSAASIQMLATAAAAPDASREIVESYNGMASFVAVPTAAQLAEQMTLHLGSWWGLAHDRITRHTADPLVFTSLFGPETLAYMLFGMAGLKSGFLTGAWADRSYRRVAVIGYAISIPAYLLLAGLIVRDGFTPAGLFTWSFAATVPIRPLMIAAMAALIILVSRSGDELTRRIAATGRAAFTNYLGTSILLTSLFYGYGLGLFGRLGRVELWLVVVPMWLLMLAWSKPWLDRYHYGPFEWLWRSLSRWELQPMRR